MNILENKPTLRDIDTILPYPLNAKKHGEDQVSRLVASIKSFGWRGNPILVDREGVIIAGHGRRLAALKLGLKQVPVVVIEDMSAEKARAFRLADNRAAVSDLDNDILKEELIDLGEDVSDLLASIFDKKELDFAVADLMTFNEGVFVDDLDTVMDEQTATTDEKIKTSDDKRVAIAKAMGFKDVKGSDVIYVTRWIAMLEAESGTRSGAEAFIEHVRRSVGKLSHT